MIFCQKCLKKLKEYAMQLKKILFGIVIVLLLNGCTNEDKVSTQAILDFDNAQKAYLNKNYQNAINLFQKSCDAGNTGACVKLADIYNGDVATKHDYIKALKLYQKTCSSKHHEGCAGLGDMYMFAAGCAFLGEDKECTDLGNKIGSDVNVASNKSAELYKISCDGGDAYGCAKLAESYENGAGVEKNENKALALREKACDMNFSGACTVLGMEYSGDYGDKPANPTKMIHYYNKSCELNNFTACNELGVMYKEGKVIQHDYVKALQYYTKSCDGGFAGSCLNIGVMYSNGEGLNRDLSKAKSYFDKACSMGLNQGCDYSSELN